MIWKRLSLLVFVLVMASAVLSKRYPMFFRKLGYTLGLKNVRNPIGAKWIAHALGSYREMSYRNCLECFEANYQKGYRFFEADFWKTPDNRLVVFHDGMEASFGLPVGFTHDAFLENTADNVHHLDEKMFANLMKEKKDWYIVTDVKNGNAEALKMLCDAISDSGESCVERAIPQLYFPEEKVLLDQFGFTRAIFTLYRFGNDIDKVVDFVKSETRISAVTMPYEWYTQDYKKRLSALGVEIYVHTLNDMNDIKKLRNQGVDGFYTDTAFEKE